MSAIVAFRSAMTLAGVPVDEAFCIKRHSTDMDVPLSALPELPDAGGEDEDVFTPSNPSSSGTHQRREGVYNVLLCGTDHNNAAQIPSSWSNMTR